MKILWLGAHWAALVASLLESWLDHPQTALLCLVWAVLFKMYYDKRAK